MSDQILASAIETLIGGTADTFVVCAGAGLPVGRKTVAEVKTLLNLSGTNTGDQDLSSYLTIVSAAATYQPIGSYASQSITISAGTGLTGGGSLAANRTLTVAYGTTSTTACVGNDARLSDSRTPTSHVHGNITNAGAIGSTATLPVITGASGVLTVGAFGTSSGTFCQGNDSRITGLGTMATKSTYQIQIALSGYDAAVSAGLKKGQCRVPIAGTITGFAITCDPANKPSAAAIQCDLNTVNLSTGALTTCLTSVASIATGAALSTGGAISGSPSVAVGDQLAVDIDQGSDGKGLLATITITAT